MFKLRLSLLLPCFFACVGAAPTSRPEQPSTSPTFSDRAHRYQTNAASVRNSIGDLSIDAQAAPAFTQRDVALMKNDLEKCATLWDSAAKNIEQDTNAAADVVQQAEKMDHHRRIWSERIQARIRAARSSPSEATYNDVMRNIPSVAIPAGNRLIAARKKSAEAQEAVADAILPDGDENLRADLADRAFTADIDAHVAEMQYHWAIEDGWSPHDPAVSSPDLRAIDQRIAALRQQRIDDYRQQRLLERRIQKEDDDSRKLGALRRDLYYKATEDMN